jgi:hypothetical protein
MATTVRELFTTWGFDIDEKPLNEMESTLKTLKHAVAALITIETGKRLFEIVSGTAEWGDQVLKTAQKIGMGTQELQAMQYAAKLADVDTGELTIGLKFLNTSLYDASQGSAQAQKKFKALGLTYKDSNGNILTVDQSLGQIADKFASMEDGPKKTALAVDLFGRSGINMIPMLNQGSKNLAAITEEAQQFGLILDEVSIRQGAEFNDNLKRMRGMVLGLRNEIGMQLMPVLGGLIKKFIEWFKLNRTAISKNLALFFSEISKYVGVAWRAFKVLIDVGNRLIGNLGGYERFTKILAAGLTAVGAAALWMQVKFLAIPLAITGAIAALYILIDDIVGYFNGKDSLIGRALNQIQKQFPNAFKFLYDIFYNVGQQFQVLIGVFETIWTWLTNLEQGIKNFLMPMVKWLDLALLGWKRLFSMVPGLAGKMLAQGSIAVQASPLGTDTMESLNAALSQRQKTPAASYRETLKNIIPGGFVNTKPTINVNVTGGMTNEQTGSVVADAVSNIFGDMIKQSSMDFAPAIER